MLPVIHKSCPRHFMQQLSRDHIQKFPNSKHLDITTVNNYGLPRTWSKEEWGRKIARIIRKGKRSLGQVVQLLGALPRAPKVCKVGHWSGHTTRLQVRSLVWAHMRGKQSMSMSVCLSVYLSVSLCVCLSVSLCLSNQ